MKHSNGPWSNIPGQDTIWSIDDVKIATVADLPWKENAVTGHRSSDTSTEFANARLISAAPELLAALQELVLAPNKIRPEKYWDDARAAIARATNN